VEIEATTQMHCPRCGCALQMLVEICFSALDSVALALEALRENRDDDALDYAHESWDLVHSSKAAAVGFISAVALRDPVETARWQRRREMMRENAAGED
jgi:hypothetical protein